MDLEGYMYLSLVCVKGEGFGSLEGRVCVCVCVGSDWDLDAG